MSDWGCGGAFCFKIGFSQGDWEGQADQPVLRVKLSELTLDHNEPWTNGSRELPLFATKRWVREGCREDNSLTLQGKPDWKSKSPSRKA